MGACRNPGGGLTRWAPWLIALVGVAIYSNSLQGPFLLDDEWNLQTNPSIRNLWDWRAVMNPPLGMENVTLARRPFINVTYAFNYALGGLDVTGYHVFNLAVHLLNGLLLYALLLRTLRRTGRPSDLARDAGGLSFLSVLLWVAHPLNTSAVNYINQRTELLMAFFMLGMLYALVRAEDSPRPLAWKAVAVGASGLGMASKEVMVVAPLLALLYDRIFLSGSLREVIRKRGGFYLALAATWVLPAIFLHIWTGDYGSQFRWSYFLTQCWALDRYLKLAFWPHPLVFDYGTPVFDALKMVWSRGLLLALLLVLTVGVYFIWPAIGFLGTVFFAVLAPSSSFNPVYGQTVAEHRMYLPLIPVVLVVVLGLWWVAGPRPKARRVLGLLGLLLVPVYGALTWQRNQDYRDAVTLWQDTVNKWPINYRAHNNLGIALIHHGRVEDGTAHFEEALRLNPDYPNAHYNLGIARETAGERQAAIESFRQAVRLRPDLVQGHGNLARLLSLVGQQEEAWAHARQALRLRPDDPRVHILLGDIAVRMRRYEEAVKHYETAWRLAPRHGDALILYGGALLATGREAEGLKRLNTALASGRLAQGPLYIAGLLARKGLSGPALSLLDPFIRSQTASPDMLNLAAWLRATEPDERLRDGAEAVRLATQALEKSRDEKPALVDTLAAAYAEAGRFEEAVRTAQKALDLMARRGETQAVASVAARLALYKTDRAYRETSSSSPVAVSEIIETHPGLPGGRSPEPAGAMGKRKAP